MGWFEGVAFGLGVPLFALLFLRGVGFLGGRLTDDPMDAPERKLQSRAVPSIGGPALFLAGLLYYLVAGAFDLEPGDRGMLLLCSAPVAAALVGAFLVGLFDDFREGGLAPLPKVLLQLLAALPLLGVAPGAWGLALVFAGVVAMNALNTFDNADGALTGLVAFTLAPLAPSLCLGLVTFLPFNLGHAPFGALPGSAERRPPRAYLGDSGSHMLGMLLLFFPGAWLALFLPLIDLARVVGLRLAAGQPAWVGDRRHLAHRLEARGLVPWQVMLLQIAIAAPAIFVGTSGLVFENGPATAAGLGLTSVLFLVAVGLSRLPVADRRR